MQKRSVSALLATAVAVAQSDVTSYFPVCPAATSTTVTLPTTVTYCPGPHCNGGGTGPMITPVPNGVGMPGVHVGEYTSVGPDGLTTVLGIWETVYNSICSTGLVPATYTITAPCPCTETAHPSILPSGFQSTVVPCDACSATGGPATVTLTTPCPTGPYASQTPNVGPAPSGAPAPIAPAQTGPAAVASAAASAMASAGPSGPVASAAASAVASVGPAPVLSSAGSGNSTVMPASASPKPSTGQYTGSAAKSTIGGVTLLVGLLAACLL